MIENKRILIRGGAGFIGSTLAYRLCEGNRLTLFDNLSRNTLEHTDLARHPNVRLVEGDILDYQAVEAAGLISGGRLLLPIVSGMHEKELRYDNSLSGRVAETMQLPFRASLAAYVRLVVVLLPGAQVIWTNWL